MLTDLESESILEEVDETGLTFEENAVLKANTYGKISGLPTLADDSGLVVDSLDGRPGVRSARYAGEPVCDDNNVEKLLREMRNTPTENRSAHFHCVVAVSMPGRETVTFDGRITGRISNEPRGSGGFGYDPVFIMTNHGAEAAALTMAQVSSQSKSILSHRGLASRKAAEWLYALVAKNNADYNCGDDSTNVNR